MRLPIPIFRSALLGAALALMMGPAAGEAQSIDRDRLNVPDLTLLDPPELEVYQNKTFETRSGRGGSFQDGVIGKDDVLTVLVAARNNGELWGSFDYVLGPENMREVWWKSSGTDLKAGERHIGRFDVGFEQLAQRFYNKIGAGPQQACLGVWLLKRNSSVAWTDQNNPNHRKKVCFQLYGVVK